MAIYPIEMQNHLGDEYIPSRTLYSDNAGTLGGLTATEISANNYTDENANKLAVLSNDNGLDNGDFRVNQRGVTTITGNATERYLADRWYTYSNSGSNEFSLPVTGGIHCIGNAPTPCRIGYKFDPIDYSKYAGKTVKLSTKTTSSNLSYLNLYISNNSEYTYVSPLNLNEKSEVTFTVPTELNNFGIFIQGGSETVNSFTVEWIKLELGSVATPFVPRPYSEELARCQRYYQPYFVHFTNRWLTATGEYIMPLYFLPMRVMPTISMTIGYYTNVEIDTIKLWNYGENAHNIQNANTSYGLYFTAIVDGAGAVTISGALDAEIY